MASDSGPMDKVTEYLLKNKPNPPFTRREYLMFKLMEDGSPWWVAIEAIASCAIDHPEWDMSETKTLEEWEKS